MTFTHTALAGAVWPVIDVVGAAPGPRLCVIAGIHPNEVAAVDGAYRAVEDLDPARLKGTVSVLPMVNGPGALTRSEYVCPVDGLNINFCFPGRADGSFSEAIADGILGLWARDATCLIDLHGGDLREEMSRFVICQLTGSPDFDERNLALAHGFGADFLVRLGPEHLGRPGRSCTARADRGQHAVFAEGGSNGLLTASDRDFHAEGILRVAGVLGMIDPAGTRDRPIELPEYRFLAAPVDGWYRSLVRAGDQVDAGARLAVACDPHGRPIATLAAPEAGYILWRVTHPIVRRGDALVGLGISHT